MTANEGRASPRIIVLLCGETPPAPATTRTLTSITLPSTLPLVELDDEFEEELVDELEDELDELLPVSPPQPLSPRLAAKSSE